MKLASVGFMREYAPRPQPTDLSFGGPTSPGDGPTAPAEQSRGSGPGAGSQAGQDPYLLRAMREHASGSTDPALWAHAMAQARDDKALATRLYLQSRATALRVAKRDDQAARRAGVVEALSGERDFDPPGVEPRAAAEGSSTATRASRFGAARKHLVLIACAVGAAVVTLGGFFALRSPSAPPQVNPIKPAATAPSGTSSVAGPAAKPISPAGQGVTVEELTGRVRTLKEAGNWNLLVINATEWTRKQPASREAWKELSLGYVELRQWRDALDASKKAVELAPDDLLLWQTLGRINVALRRPLDALDSFQHATALNERDVGSWVQQGVLNMQIRRLPDAKIAFERALAVSPGDTEALCGAASLAQKEEREKDAVAFNRQLAAAGARCPEPSPVEARVVTSVQAPAKPAYKPR